MYIQNVQNTIFSNNDDLEKARIQNEINGIKVFGPTKNQAQIEGSKHFSKNLMKDLHIPTSKYQFFLEKKAALDYIHRFYSFLQLKQIVIKYRKYKL